jgi:hypothetical protein
VQPTNERLGIAPKKMPITIRTIKSKGLAYPLAIKKLPITIIKTIKSKLTKMVTKSNPID